jgi:hypothetical protein
VPVLIGLSAGNPRAVRDFMGKAAAYQVSKGIHRAPDSPRRAAQGNPKSGSAIR